MNSEIYYKRNPTGNLVSIRNINGELPKGFSLSQNYPNPFNPFTSIKFDIPNTLYVKLTIYNLLGKEVAVLVNKKLNAGSYEVDWNASGVPSGVYFYKLETEEYNATREMILTK